MDELIKLVSQKTGLAEGMAKTAVETVVGFLKEKPPAPIAEQIDSVLRSAGPAQSVGDLARGPGGIPGGK